MDLSSVRPYRISREVAVSSMGKHIQDPVFMGSQIKVSPFAVILVYMFIFQNGVVYIEIKARTRGSLEPVLQQEAWFLAPGTRDVLSYAAHFYGAQFTVFMQEIASMITPSEWK